MADGPLILANIGIPMIFPQVILLGLAFVPVVLVETVILRKSLAVPWKRTLAGAAIANLLTTIIGVPLAWGFMLIINLVTTGGYALGLQSPAKMLAAVTLQAAWLIPYEEHLFWMVPFAATVLLVPCYAASLLIEYWALSRLWKDLERKKVFAATLRANTWSYVGLLVAGSLWIASVTTGK